MPSAVPTRRAAAATTSSKTSTTKASGLSKKTYPQQGCSNNDTTPKANRPTKRDTFSKLGPMFVHSTDHREPHAAILSHWVRGRRSDPKPRRALSSYYVRLKGGALRSALKCSKKVCVKCDRPRGGEAGGGDGGDREEPEVEEVGDESIEIADGGAEARELEVREVVSMATTTLAHSWQ